MASNSPERDDSEEGNAIMTTIYNAYAAYKLVIEPELGWVDKEPCRTSSLQGAQWLDELLKGHPGRIRENYKLSRDAFLRLAQIMREGGYVKEYPQSKVTVEEALGIFLWTVGRGHRHVISAERFQHSTETVNRQCKRIIRALVNLAPNIICHRNLDDVHPKIGNDRRFYPYFKGAIGAVDGTQISAWARAECMDAFRNRKSNIAQNVLAACDHDMRFVFVQVGWEGSANDGRVFTDALTNDGVSFPKPPEGKFYLVDSAFTNMKGFLAPYRGERYHDYGSGHRYRSKMELFNHRHSSLRIVIEQAFRVLKKRWPLAKGPMPNFKMARQGQIIMALCVLHNFIRENMSDDRLFAEFEAQMPSTSQDDPGESSRQEEYADLLSSSELAEWAQFRNDIADSLWAHFRG